MALPALEPANPSSTTTTWSRNNVFVRVPRSPTRKTATTTTSPRQSRQSQSPVPHRSGRLSPIPPQPATDSSSASSSFWKYCQLHGTLLDDESRHSAAPLNSPPPLTTTTTSTLMNHSSHNRRNDGMDGSGNGSPHLTGLVESWFKIPSRTNRSTTTTTMSDYCDHHPLGVHAKTLQYTQDDLWSVALDDATFQALKDGLRKRGVITNNYLRENLHFYVQHIKQNEARKQQLLQASQRVHQSGVGPQPRRS